MYSKTSAAVGTDIKRPSLTGIHLEIYSDTVRASACDAFRMAVTEIKCNCGGKMSVTVPKQSFFYLANAVEDKDLLEFGLNANTLVFIKSDMLFSTRIISEPFMNIDRLFDMLKVIRGDVDVYMTKRGILYASNPVSEYMLTNSKKRSVKRKSKKTKKAA